MTYLYQFITKMQHHTKKICVLGSANADFFLYVSKIPVPGQTIQSKRFMTANGGKGANQAVAVGKLAGQSHFLGQVGEDDAMRRLKTEMEQANVHLNWKVCEKAPTGMAFIYVQDSGQNSIVIHGGANMKFDNLEDIDAQFKAVIDQSDYLLLQKEVPMQINQIAAKYAFEKGKIVILDCGGRDDPISENLLNHLTYISPNETELLRIDDSINKENVVEEVRKKLIEKHPNLRVLLKLGSHGASIITKDYYVQCEVATKVNPHVLDQYKIIDTVGAGDCFTGAFAVRHSELDWSNSQQAQLNYRKAMIFGNSSAFLCITRVGAMPSMPLRSQVDEFMTKYEIK